MVNEGGIRAPVQLPSWYLELSESPPPHPDRARRLHGAAGEEVQGGVRRNGNGTWEPSPGSDTDRRVLGQQAVPLPASSLPHICLKELRRKMQNCFPLSASSPKLLPLAGGLHGPVWGFVLRDSQTFNSAAARWGKERVCCSLRLRTRMRFCDRSLLEQWAFAKCLRAPLRSGSPARREGTFRIVVACESYKRVGLDENINCSGSESSCTIPSSGTDRSSCPATDFSIWAMLRVYKSNYAGPGARQGGALDKSSFPVRRRIAAGGGSQSVACLQASRAEVWLQTAFNF